MIEKMKKVTFLVTSKEYDGFINSLREIGVVHIQQLQQGATSDELQDATALEARFSKGIQAVEYDAKNYEGIELPETIATDQTSPIALLDRIEEIQSEELRARHAIEEVEKNIEMLEPWGEFKREDIERTMSHTSLNMYFYRSSSKFFVKEWEDKYFAIPINTLSKSTYFVAFSDDTPDIQAEQIFLPKSSLSECRAQLDELNQKIQSLHAEMVYINDKCHDVLVSGQLDALNTISLSKVHLSDTKVAGDSLHLMLGWVRADRTANLVDYLEKERIFYALEDPAFEDDVPVEITNGPFTRLFEPILKMYSLPNYNDIDPSVFFAPFFMLFFGLCLGDGGYGLLVFLIGLAIAFKAKGDTKDYGKLAIWLGLMTTICGLLTGTVFGVDLTQQDWAILAPVKPYFINDNGVGPIMGYSPMMVISVIIGFIQVLLGMVLKGCKAWKNYGFGYAISSFSWVVALLTAIALFGLPELGVALPLGVSYILTGILGVSCVGIFFYNNPSAYKSPVLGPLLNIGGGVWATYGMATGLLGDLLSYIRLFALGLTGGVLGGVFNSLAYDMTDGMDWYVRWLPMCVILLAGHGITFALSMISAFVHPMRLTFVEFFKNADFAGGGKAYEPFKEIK